MKRFLLRFALFSTIMGTVYALFSYFILPQILVWAFGMNVQNQIDQSFQQANEKDYELLIMGNSKMYCGVNPDEFSVPAYNFSHNNDTYNQIYYKLLWLEKNNKKFDYLILGTDYFQFGFISDTRNYAYTPYLGEQYAKDYPAVSWNISRVKNELEFLKPYKLRTLIDFPYAKHDLKRNGQFVRRGSPGEIMIHKRDSKFLELQTKYFERITSFCKSRGIKLIVCMPPLRHEEIKQYTVKEIQYFGSFISRYIVGDVVFLDFSNSDNYTSNDFIDMFHLNQDAAVKFSQELNTLINYNFNN